MSVLKNRRNLSPHDFWYKLNLLQEYTAEIFEHVPKRRFRLICADIGTHTANAAYYVAVADEIKPYNDNNKKKRAEYMKIAIQELEALQPYLLVFWSVTKRKTKSMEYWSKCINENMGILSGLIYKETGEQVTYKLIDILHHKKVRECKYLKAVSDYHRFLIGKAIRISYDNINVRKLVEITNEVLLDSINANGKNPEKIDEWEIRKELIDNAINKLNASQPFIIGLWNMKHFEKEELDMWAAEFDDCMCLLQAIKKSDEKRKPTI